jgi:hypothetical protein
VIESPGIARPRRWLPRLPSPAGFLGFLALLVALGPALPPMFGSDGDAGRHIRVGTEILEKRQVPNADSMSHTRFGETWVAHEWGAEVAYATAARLGGLAGVATLAALLFASTVLLMYWNVILLGGTLRSALAIATAGMLLLLVHLLPRPHLITTAFASTLMLFLIQYRRTALFRWVIGIPPLFLVWANCHGGFPAGFALLTLFVADVWIGGEGPSAIRQRRTLIGVFALSVLATMINPVGPALWAYVIGHLGDQLLMDVTQEFQSPDFHAPWGKLLLGVILGIGYLLGTARRRMPLLGLTILLGTLAASLVSARHITLFAALGFPWLACLFVESPADPEDRKRSVWPDQPLSSGHEAIASVTSPIISAIAALVLLFVVNGPLSHRARYDPTRFPVRAMGFVDRLQIPGALFNEMEWGGYLLYEFPEIPVFIDGQTDFYGEELVQEYFVAHLGAPGWREVLDLYDVRWTMLRSGATLNRLLAMSPEWVLVYDDGVATVYRRGVRDPSTVRHRFP